MATGVPNGSRRWRPSAMPPRWRSAGGNAAAARQRRTRLGAAGLLLLTLAGAAGAGPAMPPPYLKLKGSVENRTIGPLHIANVYRAIETGKQARLRNVTINGVDATSLDRDGIRIRAMPRASESRTSASRCEAL